jgi:RNA polymerase sigma-70 factor (family 1)
MIDNLQLVNKRITRSSDSNDFIPLDGNNKSKVPNSVLYIEKVLVNKLIEGDSSAFENIFSAYYKDLVVFALRYTNDLNSAEEIVQDTFVKIWEEHCSIKITVSLRSYLMKVIKNDFLDRMRHKKIVQNHNLFVQENSPSFENETENYLLQSELQGLIDEALQKLPDEIAETFRMNRFKGMKYREIAEMYGISERTVEARIGKALHMLRLYLKDYF